MKNSTILLLGILMIFTLQSLATEANLSSAQKILMARFDQVERLPVIITLCLPDEAESNNSTQQIYDIQQRVIDKLLHNTSNTLENLAIKRFSITPAMGLQIDRSAFDVLLNDPNVHSIREDIPVPHTYAN